MSPNDKPVYKPRTNQSLVYGSSRYKVMLAIIFCVMATLVGRVIYLQVVTRQFLAQQGDNRAIRTVRIGAHRGMITDRDGVPLAVSTPVDTIWANPHQLPTDVGQLTELAHALGRHATSFITHIDQLRSRGFIYLKRQATPSQSSHIMSLAIKGVYSQPDYKRYYPAGDVTAPLIGLTDIDHQGEEGLELAYNHWLTGVPGKRRVLENERGEMISELRLIQKAHPGGNLTLSISLPIQFAAFQALANSVTLHQANSGSMVVMDAKTGEVLAIASYPSFNPNNRAELNVNGLRLRAITDAFEPGSVMKPLAMSAILKSGKISPNTVINTSPGYMRVNQYTIHDDRDFGRLTLAGIITKSSNIGMTKLASRVPNSTIWDMYNLMELGRSLITGFPGEATGSLPPPYQWSMAKRATLAYGYGLSASVLQLASAYSAIANNGCRLHPSLLKLGKSPHCTQILSTADAHEIITMMENVVGPYGTAPNARINGYVVAGKTGTAHEISNNGYQENAYRSNFVGIVPANDPRLIIAVSISNSRKGSFYGGQVAAPIFAQVAGQALRQLDIPPDPTLPSPHYESTRQMVQDAEQKQDSAQMSIINKSGDVG